MKLHSIVVGVILVVVSVVIADNVQGQNKATGEHPGAPSAIGNGIDAHVRQMLENGRRIFRFDTFGSEAFGARRSSFTELSPARKTRVSAPA